MLNRLEITSDIDSTTPKVVIEEICLSHSIKFKKEHMDNKRYILRVINKIYKTPIQSIPKDYENNIEALKKIGTYVNYKDKGWRKGNLLKAFNFLQSYTIKSNLEKSHRGHEIGLQTNSNPEKLNACILYAICNHFNLQTNPDSTLNQMWYLIQVYHNLNNPNIIYELKYTLYDKIKYKDIDHKTLLNIINVYCPEILTNLIGDQEGYQLLNSLSDSEDYSHNYGWDEYYETAEEIKLKDINYKPVNHLEAIVMAAIFYKIDLSFCENPYQEYIEIRKEPYFPIDDEMIQKFKMVNKYPDTFENPFINELFNPNFPPNIYTDIDLENLCMKNGININPFDTNFETPYTLLQTSCFIDNFYHGKQGNIVNTETTFFDEIEDLSYDNVIIYGVRSTNRFTGFTYGELTDTFSTYKRFQNPRTNEIFSDESIQKLSLLAYHGKRDTETDEEYNERIELAEEIERVMLYLQAKGECVEDFFERYECLDADGKSEIEKFLVSILESSMFMRGWDGESDYPLTSESTNFSMDQQIVVDHRVTQSILSLEEFKEDLNVKIKGMGDYILELPLMNYHSASNTFTVSSDIDEGLTIQDRINIVKGGEDGSYKSCIRMSSNILCSSAYYYMRILGMRLPFDIEEVSYIT